MYAVIRTGSKQYRVSPGDVITIEKLDVPEGKKCSFDDVVMFHDGDKVVASPKELSHVRVSGKVIGQGKSDKVIAVSYTHLRAHETRHDLVCRLLLEKKKKTNREEIEPNKKEKQQKKEKKEQKKK